MTRKTWGLLAIAVVSVISSYVGANRAASRALQSPKNASRLAAAQRHADSMAAVRERTEVERHKDLNRLCYFDFKHATNSEELRVAFGGNGPAMAYHPGRCQLVGLDSVRWVP